MSTDVEIIQKTQKTLGKYVKKPVLTDKLLKKPPFRFLHDVIVAVIRETGFLKGLFNDNELSSTNFTEKEMKIAFLNKLIDAVKTITKIDLKVRASKIVAGLEPNETNLLLQAIGTAIDKKISSVEYVEQMKQGKVKKSEEKIKKTTKEKTSKKPISKESPKSVDRNSNKDSSRRRDKDSKDSKQKIKSNKEKKIVNKGEVDGKTKKSPKAVEETPKTEIVELQKEEGLNKNKEPLEPTQDVVVNEEKIENPEPKPMEIENTRNLSSARPKSARPKSGDSTKPPEPPDLQPMEMKTVTPTRPKSSLRPPSVRPSSARPGAPRLRPDSALPVHEPIPMGNINVIIENVDNVDDEETVVIQNMVEDSPVADLNIALENKGHLVEQILEQIQDTEGGDGQKKVEIDWEQSLNINGSSKDVSQLRNFIQSLTKTANPLGKLLNYLHEDIEAMHSELQMWTNMKKQLFVEIEKRNRMSAESDKPLLVHLEHLQQEIDKQEQEIATVRSNILKNEHRIREILTK